MEYFEEFFTIKVIIPTLLILSPGFYPYIVKGNIPYKEEKFPDAALLVATVEGIIISSLISFIIVISLKPFPWSDFAKRPLFFLLLLFAYYFVMGISWHYLHGVSYGTRITLAKIMSYARIRYSWILKTGR